MKCLNKTITMLIVPAFVFAGCSNQDSVATQDSGVVKTADGAYVQVADTLNKSYEEAKANGYTGSYEDWVKLLELHQTNPQAASQQAASSGYSGMDMLMTGAMGMMIGNMMSNGSYNSYRDRQRSYGSSAYVRPSASNLNSARSTESRAQAAARSSATSSSSSRSSVSSVSRGGFGGAVSSGG
jgi:uncharacterized protein YgiB involved in biofilm formation